MTVRQLLRSLDSAELSEWLAFLKLEQEKNDPPPTPDGADEDAIRRAFNII